MSKKRKKQKPANKCEICGKPAPKDCNVCESCGEGVEYQALSDMYGDDAEYLYYADIFPGDK